MPEYAASQVSCTLPSEFFQGSKKRLAHLFLLTVTGVRFLASASKNETEQKK